MADALPTKLQLQIVSADRALLNESVDEVVIPGFDGYFGVLPGHTPLLAVLHVGELWYRQGQEKHYLHIAFGFAEVLPDRVNLLAEIGERAEEIDAGRAELARTRAAERMKTITDEAGYNEAHLAYIRAVTRLAVARKRRA